MKAHELIQRPEKWTQQEYARNAEGNVVSVQSAYATCFCTLGAIMQTYYSNDDLKQVENKLYNHINDNLPKDEKISISAWNDTNTHKVIYDTLKLLDI